MKLELRAEQSGSLHEQICTQIRAQIVGGTLRCGDRLPSYNQVREQYGVHTNTMEKVLARLEQEGLVERRRGAGVFVRARETKVAQGIIGLAGNGFSFKDYSAYWSQVMGGVREAAAQAGMQLLILEPNSNRGWEKADGVLICGWEMKRVAPIRAAQVPMVSLLQEVPGVASVSADDYQGSRAATEHLLQLGHRRIGFLHAFGEQEVLERRLEGYADALKAHGIRRRKSWEHEINDWFTDGSQIVAAARDEMDAWIAARKHVGWIKDDAPRAARARTGQMRSGWNRIGCTALLCHNDETAWGAIQALQLNGINVPADVSVVGFDGTEFGNLVSPRISTIEVPLREIGALGVEMLLRQINADQVSGEHRVLSVSLRERESTAAPH